MTSHVYRSLLAGGLHPGPRSVVSPPPPIGWADDTAGLIRVSPNENGTSSIPLHGAVLTGTRYIYVSGGASAAVAVTFYLDDEPLRVDEASRFTLYDPNVAFDTSTPGQRTVGALITLADGTFNAVRATFSVDEEVVDPPPPPPDGALRSANFRHALGVRVGSPRTGTRFMNYSRWVDPSPSSTYGPLKYHMVFAPSKNDHVQSGLLTWAGVVSAVKGYLGTGSTSTWLDNGTPTQATIIVSLPPILEGETLARAKTAGEYPAMDAALTDLGVWLKANGWAGTYADGRPKVLFVIGWEHNGHWFRWTICPNRVASATMAADFKATFDRQARLIKGSGSTSFLFGIAPFIGGSCSHQLVEASLPDEAGFIAPDIYDKDAGYAGRDAAGRAAFYLATVRNRLRNGYVRTAYTSPGWTHIMAWARRYNRLVGLNELAVGNLDHWGGDNAQFLQDVKEEFIDVMCAERRFIYHAYTEESDADGEHRLRGINPDGPNGTTTRSTYPLSAAYWLAAADTNGAVP